MTQQLQFFTAQTFPWAVNSPSKARQFSKAIWNTCSISVCIRPRASVVSFLMISSVAEMFTIGLSSYIVTIKETLKTQFGVLESRHSLIAALDAQGITPPSVHAELFKLQGLYTIKTYLLIIFPINS